MWTGMIPPFKAAPPPSTAAEDLWLNILDLASAYAASRSSKVKLDMLPADDVLDIGEWESEG